MQFKEFDWLSGHGIWAIIPCPTKMVSVSVILGRFCFYFKLLFYILGAFLIKQLFYSRLLDMRWLKPTRRYAPCWLSIISYPTRARRIIVNYIQCIYLTNSKKSSACWLCWCSGGEYCLPCGQPRFSPFVIACHSVTFTLIYFIKSHRQTPSILKTCPAAGHRVTAYNVSLMI